MTHMVHPGCPRINRANEYCPFKKSCRLGERSFVAALVPPPPPPHREPLYLFLVARLPSPFLGITLPRRRKRSTFIFRRSIFGSWNSPSL